MKEKQKHKVPIKVRLYRIKNTGFLTIVDRIVHYFKPSKRCKEKPGEILFIRNDKIGDALVTVPVLRDLKLNHPNLTIDVLCSETNAFVFKGLDFINKTHIYDASNLRQMQTKLKAEKYHAIVDLVSMDKKLIKLLRKCAPFLAGSRMFGFSWLYDYYLPTNWVSEFDSIPMSKKIEQLLKDCFGFRFVNRDRSLPYYKNYPAVESAKEFDILFHLGTGKIRKLDSDIEEKLIGQLSKHKVLITDGGETERYKHYSGKFKENPNLTFRQYKDIGDMRLDILKSKIVLCYDGGQAHFMGQFTRCLVLVGAISPLQWAPYDFSLYVEYRSWDNGVKALVSQGEMKHKAIYFPIWCLPCFSIGCNTRPCINKILPEQVMELISESLFPAEELAH